MAKWSEGAWGAISPIFDKIVKQPFLLGLTDGTLDKEKFLFYIRQDALYLTEFGRVLGGIAVKAPKKEQVSAFLNFAGDTMGVEKELHTSFLDQTETVELEPSPSCLLYTTFMMRQLHFTPVEVVVATVLPCFWIYKKVGDYILSCPEVANNPYQSWINTYGGEEFAQAVQLAVDIADEMAAAASEATRQEMTQAFVMCSKMEWMFWDSAWRLEEWPI